MHLIYVDESGTGLRDPQQNPYFILAAACVPAEVSVTLEEEVAKLKQGWFSWAKPHDFEIKGRDIRRGDGFFKNLSWQQRVAITHSIASMIRQLPVRLIAVQVDKRYVRDSLASNEDLYRIAFWRLLEDLEKHLNQFEVSGLLMMDARSTLHTSVQDRRTLDAFVEWVGRRSSTRLIDRPWFGFSAFYAGLQVADWVAYAVDVVHNDVPGRARINEIATALQQVQDKLTVVTIP